MSVHPIVPMLTFWDWTEAIHDDIVLRVDDLERFDVDHDTVAWRRGKNIVAVRAESKTTAQLFATDTVPDAARPILDLTGGRAGTRYLIGRISLEAVIENMTHVLRYGSTKAPARRFEDCEHDCAKMA